MSSDLPRQHADYHVVGSGTDKRLLHLGEGRRCGWSVRARCGPRSVELKMYSNAALLANSS